MRKQLGQRSMVTIRDIANDSGFAVSTVSIVLNRAPLARYIRKSTKLKIEEAARRLGYSPNQLARSLRNQRNRTIGVMVFDITDPFCTPILRGIEADLYREHYLPILTDAHNDPRRFEQSLEMLLERRVEGLIVIANWLCVDIDILSDLEKQGIPTVIIGRELANSLSSVIVDNRAGGRLVMEHLCALGHKKIAFIRGPKVLADTDQRWTGIREVARSNGHKIDPNLVVDLPNLLHPMDGFEAGYAATKSLLQDRRQFTAISAFDDVTALGAIKALFEAGIDVPGQCSVVGFDDTTPAALAAPSLTTIRQPMEMMGAAAAALILQSSSAVSRKVEFAPVHRQLPPVLVIRESSAPFRVVK